MSRPKNPTEHTRLHLDLSLVTRAKLETLQEKTNANSLAEVIRKAVWIYDYLVTEKRSGSTLIIKCGQVERELIFPELET